MKKLLYIASLIVASSTSICSQTSFNLKTNKNAYLASDSLYKYQVTYKDPGSMGRELEWDFSHLQIINDSYLIKYFIPDSADMSKICGMEHRTRYYYRQRNDSLWAIGFENYTTMMNYHKPELKMVFPLSYADTLYSEFEGEGIYSHLFPLGVKGYTQVKADAEGMLKLPDVAGKALRVHTIRHYNEVKSKKGYVSFIEEEDKTNTSNPKATKDSLQMTLDTYSWYFQGVRYPVFESIKTTLHRTKPTPTGRSNTVSDTTVFYTSFYYTPEEWSEEERQQQETTTDELGNLLPEAEQVFTEATLLPNPVVNDLIVNYKLTRSARIGFSIHNNIGQPMLQITSKTLDIGWHQEIIPMQSLITGSYTVYVYVDNMVIKKVVVKK